MSHSQIHSTVPVISTDDISKSLTYYQDILGFTFDFQYGEPPVYAGVNAGDAEIYFTFAPEHVKLFRAQSLNPVFLFGSPMQIFFFL